MTLKFLFNLPHNGSILNTEFKSKDETESTFQPKITKAVPNFKAEQSKFAKRLLKRKVTKELVQHKPFSFYAKIQQDQDKIKEEKEKLVEIQARKDLKKNKKNSIILEKVMAY